MPKYIKINIFASCICFVLILFLSIGYSFLQETLNITTNVMIRPETKIIVTNVNNFASNESGYEINAPAYTDNTVTTNVGLPSLTSTVSYNIEITNSKLQTMQIKGIEALSSDNSSIVYNVTNMPANNVVLAETTINITITLSYNPVLTTLPTNTTGNIAIEIIFSNFLIDNPLYVLDHLQLNYRGIDAPEGNVWYDDNSHVAMNLMGAKHNPINNSYEYGEQKYSTTGQTLIPTTGNFTLELLIETPSTIGSGDDMAIVSQVSDTTNDAGRFKVNIQSGSIIIFYNRSYPTNTNLMPAFTTSVKTETFYQIQLVREGDSFKMYLNNELVHTESYLSTNALSSGVFKFGYWNSGSSGPQYYTGDIYAVRLYDKALSPTELTENYETDIKTYIDQLSTVKQYAIMHHYVSSGDGLYLTGGEYVYRGSTVSNYLKFSGDPDVYRIIYFADDSTMKVVNTSVKFNIAYDASGNRTYDEFLPDGVTPNTQRSTYCTGTKSTTIADAALGLKYGCNYWTSADTITNPSNVTGNVYNDSTIMTQLNQTYYNSQDADSIRNKILTHSYDIGFAPLSQSMSNVYSIMGLYKWTGNVGTITTADVLRSLSTPYTSLSSSNKATGTYLSSLASKYVYVWTMNGADDNTWDIWALFNNGTASFGKRRASRTFQTIGSGANQYDALYYAYPAFYISSGVIANGTGTETDPFIIQL